MNQKTRVSLELIVGTTHTVEVLIHLRRQDTAWFHSVPEHKQELIVLLGDKILRKQFEKEIIAYRAKRWPKQSHTVEVGESGVSKKARAKPKRGRDDLCQDPTVEKPKRDIMHAFSDNIQVTYRLQEIIPYESATLMVQSHDKNDFQFCQLEKLSKRIILWCYPRRESSNLNELDPEDLGFPRPELIPIGSIFR